MAALQTVCLQKVATPVVHSNGRQQSSLLGQATTAPQRAFSKSAVKAVRSEADNGQNEKKSNNGMTAATRLALIGYATASLAFGHVQPSRAEAGSVPSSPQELKDAAVRVADKTKTAGLENNLRGEDSGNSTTPQLPNPSDVAQGIFKDAGGLFNKSNVGLQGDRSADVVKDAGDAAKGAAATGDISKPTFGPFSTENLINKASGAASDAGSAASDAASDAQSKAGGLGGIGDQAQAALSNVTAPLKGLTGQAESNLPDVGSKAEGIKKQAQGAFDDAKGSVQGGIGSAKNKVGGDLSLNAFGDAKSTVSGAADQAQGALSDITGSLKGLTGQVQGKLGGPGDVAEGAGRQAQGAFDDAQGKAKGAFGQAKSRFGGQGLQGNLPGQDAVGEASGRAKSIVSKAGTLSKDILGNIREAADSVRDTAQGAASDAKSGLGGLGGQGFINQAKGLQDKAEGAVSQAKGNVKGFGGQAQGSLGGAGNAAEGLKNKAKGAASSAKGNAFGLSGDAKKQVGNIQSAGDDVLSQVKSAGDDVLSQVKGALGQ